MVNKTINRRLDDLFTATQPLKPDDSPVMDFDFSDLTDEELGAHLRRDYRIAVQIIDRMLRDPNRGAADLEFISDWLEKLDVDLLRGLPAVDVSPAESADVLAEKIAYLKNLVLTERSL